MFVCLYVWVCKVLYEVYRESFHIAYACKVQTVIPWVAGLPKQNYVSVPFWEGNFWIKILVQNDL